MNEEGLDLYNKENPTDTQRDTIKQLFDDLKLTSKYNNDIIRRKIIFWFLEKRFPDIKDSDINIYYNDEFPVLIEENGEFYVDEPEYKIVIPTLVTINGENQIIFKSSISGGYGNHGNNQNTKTIPQIPTEKKYHGKGYPSSEAWRDVAAAQLERIIDDPSIPPEEKAKARDDYAILMDTTGDA